MPKRRRCDADVDCQKIVKKPHREPSSLLLSGARKSARLQAKRSASKDKRICHSHLPSPEKSDSQHSRERRDRSESPRRERSPVATSVSRIDKNDPETFISKRLLGRYSQVTANDHIAFWSRQGRWPKQFSQPKASMEESSKRPRSSSRHRSDEVDLLEDSNVKTVPERTMPGGVEQFEVYLHGNQTPPLYPGYPANRWPDVLERIAYLSEERVRRDIGQIVVPSPENLAFCGETGLDGICEELGQEWSRCAKVGPKKSKPDVTVGLRRSAIPRELYDKLSRYGTQMHPVHFTPELIYAFLTAEVKCGDVGLSRAKLQNNRHAAAAIGALIKLHWAAYGVEDDRSTSLYGKPLFFSISHNHEDVQIFAHFAQLADGTKDQLRFCHYMIKNYNLSVADGKQRFGCFNFVLNVYKEFVPKHIERIEMAARQLRQRKVVGKGTMSSERSTQASQDDRSSFETSQRTEMDGEGFARPDIPYSTGLLMQLTKLQDTVEQQRQESKLQLEQQRQESKQKEEQFEKQMLEQRQESKQKEEQFEKQMLEQRQESKLQLEQQRQESKRREDKLGEQLERLMEMLVKKG